MSEKRYWEFRIAPKKDWLPYRRRYWNPRQEYYNYELEKYGVLRQGWGCWGADLRKFRRFENKNYEDYKKHYKKVGVPMPLYEGWFNGNKRNFCLLEVKKGDIVLVPQLPEDNCVLFAKATQDWNEGYRFEVDERLEDFGHKFPAQRLAFCRLEDVSDEPLRVRLKSKPRPRLEDLTKHKEAIEELIKKYKKN